MYSFIKINTLWAIFFKPTTMHFFLDYSGLGIFQEILNILFNLLTKKYNLKPSSEELWTSEFHCGVLEAFILHLIQCHFERKSTLSKTGVSDVSCGYASNIVYNCQTLIFLTNEYWFMSLKDASYTQNTFLKIHKFLFIFTISLLLCDPSINLLWWHLRSFSYSNFFTNP